MTLVVVMGLLFALVLLGAILYSVLSVDLRNADNYNRAVRALHDADAGCDHVLGGIKHDLSAGSLVLDQAVEAVNYLAPAGFDFVPVTNLIRLADGRSYMYRVIGRSGSARACIEVAVSSCSSITIGCFGNSDVRLKSGTRVYSYRSSQTTAPTPATSTGEASVGGNEHIGGDNDAVDGTIILGEDESGNPASYSHEFTTPSEVIRTGRIDPDPLGVTNGYLASEFVRVALTNDNASATGGTLVGNVLTIEGDVALTAGDYYVDEIDLGNNETLAIDATAGPVNIYLIGGAYTQPNAEIDVSPAKPDNLRIFSNSGEPIEFQPNSHYIGFIYAPLATVRIQPAGAFYGALWADEIEVWPGGNVYIDIDFLDGFDMGEPMRIVSWKQISL